MTIKVKLLQKSLGPYSDAYLGTFELVYPRMIHSEVLTHKQLSRNCASSRAIPIETMLKEIENDIAVPVHWGKNQSGMQAKEELQGNDKRLAEYYWESAAITAIKYSRELAATGVHKQVANRITEPYQHMKTVMSGTDWKNVFYLRNHCYSDDTEVLTTGGWKYIKDVGVGEAVHSLNTDTKELEYATVLNTISWQSEGKGVQFSSKSCDLIVSDEHKMLVENNGKLTFVKAKDLIGKSPAFIKKAKVDTSFSEGSNDYKEGYILGMLLGNGWKYKNATYGNSGICVCKGGPSAENIIAKFKTAADTVLVGTTRVYSVDGVMHCGVDGKPVWEKFKDLGTSTNKKIPSYVFSCSYDLKKGVFDGMIDADSNKPSRDAGTSGGLRLCTSSEQMAGDFQRLLLELGMSGTVHTIDATGEVSKGVSPSGKEYCIETKNLSYRVSVNLLQNRFFAKSVKEVSYEGNFVCLSLNKNHTLYVRRKGKVMWCGNCDADPTIALLFKQMQELWENTEELAVDTDEFHTPYVESLMTAKGGVIWREYFNENHEIISIEDAIKISASCCAQTSFRKQDSSTGKADMVYDRLVNSKPVHASPFEHQGKPMQKYDNPFDASKWEPGITHVNRQGELFSGNFRGWIQHRQLIEGNFLPG